MRIVEGLTNLDGLTRKQVTFIACPSKSTAATAPRSAPSPSRATWRVSPFRVDCSALPKPDFLEKYLVEKTIFRRHFWAYCK